MRKQIEQLVQLNEGQRYTLDRAALIKILDEALATARPRTNLSGPQPPPDHRHLPSICCGCATRRAGTRFAAELDVYRASSVRRVVCDSVSCGDTHSGAICGTAPLRHE